MSIKYFLKYVVHMYHICVEISMGKINIHMFKTEHFHKLL